MATNFVARDGDKLAYPAVIVCAGIPQGWEFRKNLYPYEDSSTSCNNFVNFNALNP